MAEEKIHQTEQLAASQDGAGPPITGPYGPGNPHPLSRLQTELVWEGKYDEYGDQRAVHSGEMVLPIQRIETIDEPRARSEAQGDLFDPAKAHLDDFTNRLIWGDNKLVMGSLLSEFKGNVDLVYIDPPFDVGADFTMSVPIGDETDSAAKDQSALEVVAYRDTWGKGTDSYLHMMYERLVLIRELLSEKGTLYLHTDWHVGHYLKALCLEIFGEGNFINEVTWHYYNKMAPVSRCFPRSSDRILSFAKSRDHYSFHQQYEKREKPVKQLKRQFIGGKAINVRDAEGRVQYQLKDQKRLDDVWRLPMLQPADKTEYLAFRTQKPEALVERIISASTDEGDLVADFFCGSGTTGAAAEKLGRRWIMADLGRFAIHTTRKRMIEVQRKLHEQGRPYRAFDVGNLGRYERQWWQKERLKGADSEHRRVILDFFKAELLPNAPSPMLHGRKGAAFCHVDAIDSIFTRDEAKAVASVARDSGATRVFCLSWEFEMDLRIECNRLEKELGVEIKLIQIPREIMEKNRKEPPPFLEVATLSAEPVFGEQDGKKTVDIKLTSFLPSLSEVPTRELETLKDRAMKSAFDFIDFWAVDFDFKNGEPFHHDWQDYRLRKDRSLKTTSEQRHVYPKPSTYTACVKVVDIFGSDTSVTVEVPYG
jgi:adenine-specific DNA-methyltransferase